MRSERACAMLLACVVWALAALGAAAAAPSWTSAHGSRDEFRTTVVSVEPSNLPVDVRIIAGDQLRFENAGTEQLVLCGYDPKSCDEWVRIGPGGVWVDRNTATWYRNRDELDVARVPRGVGIGGPSLQLVRRAPAAYAYHDHRVHWMGAPGSLPPNVDAGNPDPQRVYDADVAFRYGQRDGVARVRLEYIGGRSLAERYGSMLLVVVGTAAMGVAFLIDRRARRRRGRRRPAECGRGSRGSGSGVSADG